MINHRLLVHSKWCKTEKKEKSEPSRVSNSTKASRKSGDASVLLISLGLIVNVTQYEFTRWQSTIMAIF
jgi:hypothetical protein